MMTFKEIAERTGWSEAAVKGLYGSGMQKIRRRNIEFAYELEEMVRMGKGERG